MAQFAFLARASRGPARWFAAAGLVAAAATLNAGYLGFTAGKTPYTLFYPTLIAAAFYCGRAPSYAALGAAAFIVATFWLPPFGSPVVASTPDLWGLAGFVLTSALLIETALAATRYAERLERQRTELQTMLELIPVGVAVAHDPRADRITVSPNFAAVLGLSLDQNASLSGPGAERIPYRCMKDGRELSPEELPMQAACRTGREVLDFDVDLVYGDGRRVELMISAAPLFDEHGRVRGAIGAHVDISKLKSAQRVLDEASRQKDEFLATLAHELRNPMAPIRYAAALLRPDAGPATVAKARATIERQAAHMNRLLDDLLDVSRITRNVIELKSVAVDLRTVVTAAADAARTDIEQRRHRLELELPPDGVWVVGDADRLHQVVLNLLTNAAKYTDPGGRIRVAVEALPGQARVTVADTGIGLAPEAVSRIFDLFCQVHPGREGGLGIGLSVVRRLVEMHGGQIAVTSPGLGRGAEFSFTLPATPPPASRETASGRVVVPFRATARVLVIDDNRDSADALASLLRAHDFAVQVAYDGAQGTTLAEASRPDAIVLDIGMPDMSGYDVAQWVRARPWGSTVRLVAVTGWGQAQDRARVRAAGFDDHFVKPADPDALVRRLRELVPDARSA